VNGWFDWKSNGTFDWQREVAGLVASIYGYEYTNGTIEGLSMEITVINTLSQRVDSMFYQSYNGTVYSSFSKISNQRKSRSGRNYTFIEFGRSQLQMVVQRSYAQTAVFNQFLEPLMFSGYYMYYEI
jgi:hypothetical protein